MMVRVLAIAALIGGSFAVGGAFGLSHPPSRVAQQQPTVETSAAPTTAPSSGQSAQPSATATPLYKYVFVPTPSPAVTPFPGPREPKILEVALNEQTLVTPGDLRVRVLTSPDVTSVTAKAWGYEIAIPRVEQGKFAGQYQVPQAPAFLSGRSFDVDFVAAVSDGRTATFTLKLGLK